MQNKVIQKTCKHHGLTDYLWLKSENRYRCKKCRYEAVSHRRRKVKKQLIEIFGGKCEICGYNKYQGALEFHHVDPTKKEFGISARGLSKAFDKMLNEAKKCILVCSNCHMEIENNITDISSDILIRFQ